MRGTEVHGGVLRPGDDVPAFAHAEGDIVALRLPVRAFVDDEQVIAERMIVGQDDRKIDHPARPVAVEQQDRPLRLRLLHELAVQAQPVKARQEDILRLLRPPECDAGQDLIRQRRVF